MLALMPTRQQALGLATFFTVALCGWTAWGEREVHGLSVNDAIQRRQIMSTVSLSQELIATGGSSSLLERDPLVESKVDLFRFVNFRPSTLNALPPLPSPTPPKPSAPTFPYQYFGRMVDVDGRTVNYLTRGDTLIPIQISQLLDSAYRIDAITETQIVVTYVPLEEKIIIAVQAGH